ncbi:MAG: bacillithiol biosynthesis cysteine-adding enzyme BshC [Bryobacteraceae bacterium]
MESTCIRHTELPHTTRMFADFAYHFDRVQAFYRHAPGAYAEAAAEIGFPDERRAALVRALRIQNDDEELLGRLAQPGTLAVVTGQQVGLYSGPAYTLYKALTAVKLARQLTDSGIPAVPVFWLATEDHDFAEINHCWTFDSALRPVELRIDGDGAGGRPVGDLVLDTPPAFPLDGFAFGDDVRALVEAAYRPGATFGGAFSGLLRSLLPAHGLLYVDPMLPAMRELAAPAMRAALDQAPELAARIEQRNLDLVAGGYHAQVHVEEHTSLVFLLEGGRRIALKRSGREYAAEDRRFTSEELRDRAASLSPNALLRPVVQDSILPTVAYVGGPAELAYLAQSEVIYRAVLGRMPVALSRSGFTLLDKRSEKLLRRYQLSAGDCFHGEEHLRERAAAVLVPAAVSAALEEARGSVARSLDSLDAELDRFDPTLAAALVNSRRKIDFQVSRMDHKIRREALRRDDRAARDAASLAGLVYPHKHLQERLYSILPFLARHGLDLIDRVYENIELDCPDHRLLVV